GLRLPHRRVGPAGRPRLARLDPRLSRALEGVDGRRGSPAQDVVRGEEREGDRGHGPEGPRDPGPFPAFSTRGSAISRAVVAMHGIQCRRWPRVEPDVKRARPRCDRALDRSANGRESYFLPIIFLASMACSTAVLTFIAVVLAASALDFASRYFSELKAVSASASCDSAVARSAFICSRSAWVPLPLGALSSKP